MSSTANCVDCSHLHITMAHVHEHIQPQQPYGAKAPHYQTIPIEGKETPLLRLEGWPTSPNRVHSSLWMTIWDGIFDLLLFACAVAFLAFAAIVSLHDEAPTLDNPRTTSMLLNAIKYVSEWSDFFVCIS
jgi:hypothetical protein